MLLISAILRVTAYPDYFLSDHALSNRNGRPDGALAGGLPEWTMKRSTLFGVLCKSHFAALSNKTARSLSRLQQFLDFREEQVQVPERFKLNRDVFPESPKTQCAAITFISTSSVEFRACSQHGK
eukprot:1938596-Amphidinium_carterae.1